MKIKYIAEIPMMSAGVTYEQGRMYDVKDVFGKRLLTIFPTKFEELVIPKPKPAIEPKPKPAIEPKVDTEK